MSARASARPKGYTSTATWKPVTWRLLAAEESERRDLVAEVEARI